MMRRDHAAFVSFATFFVSFVVDLVSRLAA